MSIGFNDGYAAPGSVAKASQTMMHARGSKRVKRAAGRFSGADGVQWDDTQQRSVEDPAGEGLEGDSDVLRYPGEEADRAPGRDNVMMLPPDVGDQNDQSRFWAYHSQFYEDVKPNAFLDSVCDDADERDEGGMHLACCAAHLAQAKQSHDVYDSEACDKSLAGAMYHLQEFHKALKGALNQ